MYEVLAQDLKTGTDAATKRMSDLFNQIGNLGNGSIDWKTGRTTINNGGDILKGIRTVIGDGGANDPAANFLALLQDGFVVPTGAPSQDDPSFRFIPWRSLYDPLALQSMTQQDWDWLGINAATQTTQLSAAIGGRFSYHPEYVLDQAHAQSLTASAQFYLSALQKTSGVSTLPTVLPMARIAESPIFKPTEVEPIGLQGLKIGIEKPQPTGTVTQAESSPPPPAAPQPASSNNALSAEVLTLIEDMVNCFKGAGYSVAYAWFVPVGIKICLGHDCAQTLISDFQKVISATGGSAIAIIGSIIAEGWAALSTLTAIQWVGLAILHFAVYWWLMLMTNITPRGVCIVHFFPWISGLSGGLVNGYAQGQ